MSRPTKHPRTGVYQLRRRVPVDLVEKLGRKEITKSLGTRDPEEAKRRHSELMIELDSQWAILRTEVPAGSGERPRDRLITEKEAHLFAKPIGIEWFELHRDDPSEQLTWQTNLYDGMWTRYPLPPIDQGPTKPAAEAFQNFIWKSMRKRCFDHAQRIIDDNGYQDDPWSLLKTAKAVGVALQKASVQLERYETGELEYAEDSDATATPANQQPSQAPATAGSSITVSLKQLVEDWWTENKLAGLKPATYESYRNTIANFGRFLKHDDASLVTKKDVIGFKDHRLVTPSKRTGRIPSAKTVKDSDLAGLKAVFDWAVRNDRLPVNPAAGVTIKLAKPARTRSKGFTDEEAKKLLQAALSHDQGSETDKTFAAKKWVPWIAAFTGARVGELAQLRKEDVFEHGDGWVIRITPEAGTVKTNEAREIPLHPQIIELGFGNYVKKANDGYLFLNVKAGAPPVGPWRGLKNRLAEASRLLVPDQGVAPNHGWRHRFKTVGMEAGIPPRILDAIAGHTPRSVADSYGDVTLRTKRNEIAKLPRYNLRSGQADPS